MSESTIDLFAKQFSTIFQMVEDSDDYRLDIVEPHNAIGCGLTTTVLFRHSNNRAFGATWHVERGLLHGLRSRHYDASKPDDHPANADWLGELTRRLSTDGKGRDEIANALGISRNHYTHAPRMRAALARRAY